MCGLIGGPDFKNGVQFERLFLPTRNDFYLLSAPSLSVIMHSVSPHPTTQSQCSAENWSCTSIDFFVNS